jgi:hypothetical protein
MKPEYAKLNEVLNELYDKHRIALEALTREQFIDLVTQIIESGDIHRYVRVDIERQKLVYVPGRQVAEYKQLAESYRAKLKSIHITLGTMFEDKW